MRGKSRRDGTISRNTHLAFLAAVTLLAAALRCHQARESLWLDELHSSWTVANDFYDVAARAKIGNQSPTYFYLAWAFSLPFGMSEISLRLPSLLAGAALVPLVYALGFGWTNSRGAALLAALLTALDRDLIYFSQEARPYAFVQFVALVQLFAFWKLTAASTGSAKDSSRSWASRQAKTRVVFSLGTALLVWLHYTAALLVVAEVVYFVFLAWRGKGSIAYFWYDIAFDLLVAAVFCYPLKPHLQEVFGRRHLWRQFVDAYPTWSMLHAAAVYVVLPLVMLGLVGTIRWLAGRVPSLGRIDGRAVALCCSWLVIPAGLAWVSTYFDLARLFFPRYLMASAMALPAATGLALAMLPSRLWQWLYAVVIVLASVGTSGMALQFAFDGRLHAERDEDWRGAVALIARAPEDKPVPIWLVTGLIEEELLADSPSDQLLDYCRFPLSGLYRLDQNDREIALVERGVANFDLESESYADGCWLVTRGDPREMQWVILRIKSDLLPQNIGLDVEFERSFGNVQVARLRLAFSEQKSP